MITGKTASGFEFSVNEESLDNMELLDAIAEVDSNPLAVSKVLNLVLGADQCGRLYDHVRNEDGRVPIAAVSKEIVEIINASGQTGKN